MDEEIKRSNILSNDLISMIYKYTDFKPRNKIVFGHCNIVKIDNIIGIHIEDYLNVNDKRKVILTLENGKLELVRKDKKSAIIYYNKIIDRLKESNSIYGIEDLYYDP